VLFSASGGLARINPGPELKIAFAHEVFTPVVQWGVARRPENWQALVPCERSHHARPPVSRSRSETRGRPLHA